MISLRVIEDILKQVLMEYRIAIPLKRQLITAIMKELK